MKNDMGTRPGKPYSGRLFVVEGCDGSGKSTHIYLLRKWLESKGHVVYFTEWNSSELIKDSIKKAKKKKLLTPTTFSLMHASDFADRYEKLILPHLRAGYIVLCDRYVYTAYARDVARGCDMEWVKNLYEFAVKPTITFYFKVPLDLAVKRILAGRPELKYHEAGMDMGWSDNPVESFKKFQGLVMANYDSMIDTEGFTVIHGERTIEEQQADLWRSVQEKLKDYKPPFKSRMNMRYAGGKKI